MTYSVQDVADAALIIKDRSESDSLQQPQQQFHHSVPPTNKNHAKSEATVAGLRNPPGQQPKQKQPRLIEEAASVETPNHGEYTFAPRYQHSSNINSVITTSNNHQNEEEEVELEEEEAIEGESSSIQYLKGDESDNRDKRLVQQSSIQQQQQARPYHSYFGLEAHANSNNNNNINTMTQKENGVNRPNNQQQQQQYAQSMLQQTSMLLAQQQPSSVVAASSYQNFPSTSQYSNNYGNDEGSSGAYSNEALNAALLHPDMRGRRELTGPAAIGGLVSAAEGGSSSAHLENNPNGRTGSSNQAAAVLAANTMIEMEDMDDSDMDDSGSIATPRALEKRAGRRKIRIEYIEDKSRRHITFSKRKAGIMKKAYELSTLTGTQVLLLVASETGHVYTFATPKLQPLITKPEGKNLIQACLNAPDMPSPAEYAQIVGGGYDGGGSGGGGGGGEDGNGVSGGALGGPANGKDVYDERQTGSYAAAIAGLAAYPSYQGPGGSGAGGAGNPATVYLNPAHYPAYAAAAAAAAAAHQYSGAGGAVIGVSSGGGGSAGYWPGTAIAGAHPSQMIPTHNNPGPSGSASGSNSGSSTSHSPYVSGSDMNNNNSHMVSAHLSHHHHLSSQQQQQLAQLHQQQQQQQQQQ